MQQELKPVNRLTAKARFEAGHEVFLHIRNASPEHKPHAISKKEYDAPFEILMGGMETKNTIFLVKF